MLFIPEWRFRHIRYVDGITFHKLQRKLSPEKLEEFFSSKGIYEAYYSVAMYVNPHRIKARNTENPLETLFLRADLFFDIDIGPSVQDIERAREEALKVLDFVREKGFSVKYMAFSGSKGFHIAVEDPNIYEGMPQEREWQSLHYRRALLKEIKERSLHIDEAVFLDTRRIVRIPGTFNAKSGYMCRLLTYKELSTSAAEILAKTPRKLLWPWKLKLRKFFNSPWKKPLSRASSPEAHLFLKSNVLGTHRHVLMAELPPSWKALNRAKAVLMKYRVYPAYYMFYSDKLYLFSPVALDMGRAAKVLKALKAHNEAAFLKYKHAILPFALSLPLTPLLEGEPYYQLSAFHASLVHLKGSVGLKKGRLFFAEVR